MFALCSIRKPKLTQARNQEEFSIRSCRIFPIG